MPHELNHIRLLCLTHLDAARPSTMTDAALHVILCDTFADFSLRDLQRDLDYLAMRDLLTINKKHGRWHLKPTHRGVEMVEASHHSQLTRQPRRRSTKSKH